MGFPADTSAGESAWLADDTTGPAYSWTPPVLNIGDRIRIVIEGDPDRILKVASTPVTKDGLTSFTAINVDRP